MATDYCLIHLLGQKEFDELLIVHLIVLVT